MRPWLSHYDPGVAYSLSYPNNCVHDLLMEQAARNPDRIAVIYNELSVSYATIDRQSQILAGNLTQLKIRPGDRVGICLRNSIEFVVAFFGILKAGGVVAALNPGLTTKELDGQIAITGLEVVITDQNHLEKFVDTTGFTRLRELVVVGEPEQDGFAQRRLHAAQGGFDARHQLARAEGLGQVVIRADG